MIKKIISRKTTFFIQSLRPIQYHTILHPMTHRIAYGFSETNKLPKNKEEAWMMQQQKNLKKTNLDDQSSNEQYKGVTKVGITGILVAISSLLYMLYNANKISQQNLATLEEDITGLVQKKQRQSAVGGEWTLVNTDGKPFSSRDLRGYYYLVYFGFSKCPEICPSALYSISSIYRIVRNLPQGAYLKLKIVFISIDPERDTPSVLKKYLQQFGKHIIGLTVLKGDEIELNECMKKFAIKSKRFDYEPNQRRNNNDYNIDHTTRVYLMDPENVYLYHLDASLTQQQSAKAIIAKIVQNEHRRVKAEQQFNKQD